MTPLEKLVLVLPSSFSVPVNCFSINFQDSLRANCSMDPLWDPTQTMLLLLAGLLWIEKFNFLVLIKVPNHITLVGCSSEDDVVRPPEDWNGRAVPCVQWADRIILSSHLSHTTRSIWIIPDPLPREDFSEQEYFPF